MNDKKQAIMDMMSDKLLEKMTLMELFDEMEKATGVSSDTMTDKQKDHAILVVYKEYFEV